MAQHILRCRDCRRYTMEQECPDCGGKSFSPKPAKYSPEDRYGKYRRQVKRKELEDKELL